MRVRHVVGALAACFLAGTLAVPASSHAESGPSEIAGAYEQITVGGERVGVNFAAAEQAMATYAAIHQLTGDPEHRRVFDALLDYILERRPSYMGTYFGRQVMSDPFLRSHDQLLENVDTYVEGVVNVYAADPAALLRRGDIRTLSGRADLLVAYAGFLEDRGTSDGTAWAETVRQIEEIDKVARALLDRIVELQYTHEEASTQLANDRHTGAFPHLVRGDHGSMGSWDVENWAPAMLSLDSYLAIEALANGYGRYHTARYNRAAAAGARQLLATETVEPDLIYAGSPAGFPLDGASFLHQEETGEHLYLQTYGWSPNAIAQLGSALSSLRENRVTVPRSAEWLRVHWRGTPPEAVLDPTSFWQGLEEKVAYTHDFLEATQLPVTPDMPWIDLPRTSFPGLGTEPFRRGGWYDGSGRGAMSAVYSRLTIDGYVASGGDDVETVERLADWWDGMLVWQ